MAKPVSSFEHFKDQWNAFKHERDLFAFFLFDDRMSHRAVQRFVNDEFEWLDALARAARIYFFMFLGSPGLRSVPTRSASPKLKELLYEILSDRLMEEELKTLYFLLGVDFADVPGETKPGKVRELILLLERQGRIDDLIRSCVRLRPDIEFAEIPPVVDYQQHAEVGTLRMSNPSLDVARVFGIRVNQLPGIVLFTLAEDDSSENKVSSGIFFPLEQKLFSTDLSAVEAVFVDLFTIINDCRKVSSNPQQLLSTLHSRIEEYQREVTQPPTVKYLRQAIQTISTLPSDIISSLRPAMDSEYPGTYLDFT